MPLLMSGLPPKADIAGQTAACRFVPEADILLQRCDSQPATALVRNGAIWLLFVPQSESPNR